MQKRAKEVFLTIILVNAFLFFYYHSFILHPNAFLTAASPDGIKSYAVIAGHIKNDTDYTNYHNMNYPYGQTHIFTDGETGITNLLKFLSNYNSFFETHCLALINLMMIFSYAGCAFFLCLIFQKLRLPSLFVVLGSVGVSLLSPQIFRMGGHISLSYTVFFPLSWWLFIQYFESSKRILYSSLIIFNSVFWFSVHPYYLMINTIFYGSYYLVLFLQKRRVFQNKRIWAFAFSQIALPLLLTRIYILIADTHSFRSEFPYGFWAYCARITTVFLPVSGGLLPLLNKIIPIHGQPWEGWAYVGFPAVIIAGYTIFRWFRYGFRKKFKRIVKPVLPALLQPAVWASVLALLFSMSVPFCWHLEWLVDHIGFIRQFRSLGRFAWIFYYVFTVYTVYLSYLIYRKFKMQKQIKLSFIYIVFLFSMFFIESYGYHRNNADAVFQTPNLFNPALLNNDFKELIAEVNSVKQNYQCIIPLPYYNVGNENFTIDASSGDIMRNSFVLAHYTNMPLLSNSAARSPISEGKKNMQFFSPSFFKKEIQNDLPDKKSFLILSDKEDLPPLEEYWVEQSKKIFENNSFILYELSYGMAFDIDETKITSFEPHKDSLIKYKGLLVSSMQDTIVYMDFDSIQSPHVFRGAGALKGIKKNYSVIIDRTNVFLKTEQEYVISFWYYNKGELRNQINCVIEEYDEKGNSQWNTVFSPSASMKINGDWSLVERKFRLRPDTKQFKIFVKGDDRSEQEFFLDDFIIRPVSTAVYYASNDREDVKRSLFMQAAWMDEKYVRQDKINDIMNSIRNSPDWLKMIKGKANLKDISIDSMIYLDAVYVYEEELKKRRVN